MEKREEEKRGREATGKKTTAGEGRMSEEGRDGRLRTRSKERQ